MSKDATSDMINTEFKGGGGGGLQIAITHMLTEDEEEGKTKDSIDMFEAIRSL